MKYIENFKKYKYLLWELIKKEIKLKYRRSYLGVLWTLLEPLLTMIVLSVVFSQLRGSDDVAFPVFILTGRLLYSFFTTSTKSALKSIHRNGSMIRKVYVPKYIYPLSTIFSNYIIFAISLIDLIGVAIVCRVTPSWYMIEALVPLVTILLMSIGVGMILSTMAVFFRDLEYLWSVATMIIFYCSAIFYEPAKVIKSGFGWIFRINPVYSCIVNFRNTVLYKIPLDAFATWYPLAFSLVTIVFGTWLFYKKQDEFILNL